MEDRTDPRQKYIYHDIHIEDISRYDIDLIKSNAITLFVNTQESRQVPLIIKSFMNYLTANGYRITKDDEET